MPWILPFGRVVPPVGGAALRLPLGGLVLAALLLGAPSSAPHSRLGAQTTPAGGAPEMGTPEVQARRTRALAALDRYWRATLARSPFLASSPGDRTANRRFPREGPEVRRQQVEEEFQLYKELSSLDTRGLDEQLRLDVSLLAGELSERVDAFRLHTHLAPIHQRSGPQLWIPVFHQRMRFEREGDFDDYLARLSQVPAHLDGVRELLEQGMETGFLPPRRTLAGVLAQFDAHLVEEVGESLFHAPFEQLPPTIPAERREELLSRAREVILGEVIPAFARLRAFIADTYVHACRESIGAIDFPQGVEFYASRVRHFTTTLLEPGEIHLLGLKEVSRIRAEMERVIEEIGCEGSFGEFIDGLRSDPRFTHESPEALLAGYRDLCKRVDALLPRFFGRLPRAPYGVRAIPAFEAPRSTTAYYQPCPPDGSQPGWFYANTHDLPARPKYEMVPLALHEAVPGHHLQLALQGELEGVHPYRSSLHFTAFIEGWALYAESLGIEMGLYEDPYDDFGRLTYEMWRALRLVVDTGLHQFGWTRSQAIDFMLENSALSRTNVEAEVDRYIAWPAQALAYKIGELEIRKLRTRAEEQLGTRFDLRAFHDHLLAVGSLPIRELETRMLAWIAAERERAAE
ncbi:MAG: DUF885 domain-containing protein [Planctomycetota bacterium]